LKPSKEGGGGRHTKLLSILTEAKGKQNYENNVHRTVVFVLDSADIGLYKPQSTSTYIPGVPQCLSPRWNWDPRPLSRKRVCPPLGTKGGREGCTHSPACEGMGELQFGRLERKLSTLSTPWCPQRKIALLKHAHPMQHPSLPSFSELILWYTHRDKC
jgi:hypothetical protein